VKKKIQNDKRSQAEARASDPAEILPRLQVEGEGIRLDAAIVGYVGMVTSLIEGAAGERRRDRRDVGAGAETTQHRAPPENGLCSGVLEEKRSVGPVMRQEVELSALDLRYESYRMKNPALEGRLLASIARRGIEEPLEGVERSDRNILLNGFKRYRCASKLGIQVAPYASLAEDEAAGILNLLRVSNDRSLTILEQAQAWLD
jgi:hypothetical protein